MVRRPLSNRSGLTLIELLVALGIVAVLLGITIPAIQMARESGRRATCQNNLRQLGLSLQQYVEAWQTYPVNGRGPYSVHSMLLPYLDAQVLYASINFTQILPRTHDNDTYLRWRLAVFVCPSNLEVLAGGCCYAANRGRGVTRYGYDGLFPNTDGIAVTPASVSDGASHTSAFAEWIAGPSTPSVKDLRRPILDLPGQRIKPDEFEDFVAACRGADGTLPADHEGKGPAWLRGDFSFSYYNHVMNPNEHSCSNGGIVPYSAYTAGSLHPGATHVVFADGHVSPLKDSIAASLWRAYGSRAGGELAGE